jgi:hypothetical protein
VLEYDETSDWGGALYLTAYGMDPERRIARQVILPCEAFGNCCLAELLPAGRYAEIPGAYVLSMLDDPEAVAREIGRFLVSGEADGG